jgi:hypothetical protein
MTQAKRGLNVFFQNGFIGVVADSAGAAQEEYRGGHASCHHHRVVACAASHQFFRQACRCDCVSQIGRQALVHGHGWLIHLARDLEGESAFICDGLRLGDERFDGGFA